MNIFFVGAGGIGMANLVRYCMARGHRVAGYDRTPSDLTDALRNEGARLFFDDDPALIGDEWRDPAMTTVVYTPAIPDDNRVLGFFRQGGFEVIKRAEMLGRVTRDERSVCVAGSHGKTTTSSMVAHILSLTPEGCNAFLGGILRNTGSNLMLSDRTDIAVVEADEYDRSFHRLRPWVAVVTSVDPDHLDIYGDEAGYLEGFAHFTSLIRPGGLLVLHEGLKLHPRTGPETRVTTYSGRPEDTGADWHAENIRWGGGTVLFDIRYPGGVLEDLTLGVPVEINIDNAVGAAAAAMAVGAPPEAIRLGLETFKGAKRRFEIWRDGRDGHPALIDDYAHSPAEVRASIESVRKLFPGRELTVIFQPHLYTRTRDFAPEFAEALSAADRVVLTEIYPARELPIPGVDSALILKDVNCKEKIYCERKDLLSLIKNSNFDVVMTLGAADLDRALPDINELLS